jgi:hypothetical protein
MDKLPTNINLTPHLVNNPLALIAFAVAAIVVLGIAAIWIPLVLAVSLIVVVVVVVGIPVAVLLRNPEGYHAATKEFEGFEGEASQALAAPEPSGDLDGLRVKEIGANRGLFLGSSSGCISTGTPLLDRTCWRKAWSRASGTS